MRLIRQVPGTETSAPVQSVSRVVRLLVPAAVSALIVVGVTQPEMVSSASRNGAEWKTFDSPSAPQTASSVDPAATPTPGPAPAPTISPTAPAKSPSSGQAIKLFYFRQATKIVAILNAVANQPGTDSDLKGLIISNPSEDEIILYGTKEKREMARRVIATLDLPRPGITMEMWGIQISSNKPNEMARVMTQIRQEIDRTQHAVRETYEQLQLLARKSIPAADLDPQFKTLLRDTLYYTSALDANRPLSLADILLRMIASNNPEGAAKDMAIGLNKWLEAPEYQRYVASVTRRGKRPFERFFNTRGINFIDGQWTDRNGTATTNAVQGRVAVLEFALNYGRLVHEPERFNPYYLQQAAETLNTRLQSATDALNLDMQDLFVEPTLLTIQGIVEHSKDVGYAQVGKTSVSSLSGTPTEVTSHSVSAFDVTPPLRLSELLTKAGTLSQSVGTFVPKPADNLVGAMPLAQVIGLIGALGEERSVWRELQAGVSLTITPNVLRNMVSAELQLDLKTGDPLAGTREQQVKPLSRVSQHDVKTSIYVNALDFFDLSAFASQSTLGGRRGYVPIIGPVWQGLFGEIPVAGKLFSWQKRPQTVYNESLVLTNSFITPTVMGIALLYPTDVIGAEEKIPFSTTFENQQQKVESYKKAVGYQ